MNYRVVAIEREYASGGLEIGKKLAEKLDVSCYNKEILNLASKRMGVGDKDLLDIEESISGKFLFSLNMFADIASGKTPGLTKEQKLAVVESEIIQELALVPCVIIGRGAAGLLDKSRTLRVFIYSTPEFRKERAVKEYQVVPDEVESTLLDFDKNRANYFKAATGKMWRDPRTYDIVLNSQRLGIDNIVDILYSIVK